MTATGGDPPLAARGPVEAALREEHPGLYIRWLEVDRGSGRTSRGLKHRLAGLSDRFGGPQAIAFRTKPIPAAYRVFYRHIGLDPDQQPTPPEAIVRERMLKGGFLSSNLLDDALTVAMIESGVPVSAFDADALAGPLGIRQAVAGESLEGRPGELPPGTLVIADEARPVALLFGAIGAGRGVRPATRRTVLAAVGVSGVPEIAVEEALWLAAEIIAAE